MRLSILVGVPSNIFDIQGWLMPEKFILEAFGTGVPARKVTVKFTIKYKKNSRYKVKLDPLVVFFRLSHVHCYPLYHFDPFDEPFSLKCL